MPDTLVDGTRIHWQEAGSGTPVLLIMGATFSSALWYPVLPALTASHHVIWFDNRGTGESAWTPESPISMLAADARAVLDAAGVERAHVYGISLGGVIALQLALESPDRVTSLVLGATGIFSADKKRAPKAAQAVFRLPRGVLLALTKRRLYGASCPPEAMAADLAMLRRDTWERRALVAQQNGLREYVVTTEQVASLTMPALVLHGSADQVAKPEWGQELAATLPDARHISYDGVGHNYLVAVGDRANADVLDFLAEVDAR